MTLDLLEQSLPAVRNHIYPHAFPITTWKIKESDLPNGHLQKLDDSRWPDFRIPGFWGGYDRTAWFRTTLVIPPTFDGKAAVLRLDLPEALLFVNGKAFAGLDKNHTDILLTDQARAGQTYHIAIQAYSGRTKNVSTFDRAELAVLYRPALEYHTGLSILRELDKLFGSGTPESKEVREVLRKALIFVKYFRPDGEEYPNAIARGLRYLQNTFENELQTAVPATLHLIPQSHIDLVWLWTRKEARRKCGRTFSSILGLLEEFPHLVFSQSQAQLYEYVRQDYPHLFQKIQQRAAEGRWEPAGSMWVEPDCNLPNGESLVRQILYGTKYFKQHFGTESPVAWLPDTFGFNGALPQILRKSGIRYFFSTKLSWNDSNPFPYQTFWWKGIDGTKILAHFPPLGLEAGVSLRDLHRSWDRSALKEQVPDVAQTFGYGDGGGGPTREQAVRTRLLKQLPALPVMHVSTALPFFRKLEEQAADLPVWEGELYLERHRGTYTTHGWIKKANRTSETLLYNAELLATLAFLAGRSPAARRYPQADLAGAWEKVLLNQFHDILPGTAIAEAYEDTRQDYETLRSTATAVMDRSLNALLIRKRASGGAICFSAVNTLPWERSEYVELAFPSGSRWFTVTDDRGAEVPHQILDRSRGSVRMLCWVGHLPPLGLRTLTVNPAAAAPSQSPPWTITPTLLETPLYRIRFDRSGRLTSLHDKAMRRELLAKDQRANVFQTFVDKPKEWEAWDIDAEYFNRKPELFKFKSSRVLAQGPLCGVIEYVWKTANGSAITQQMVTYHASRRIDFRTRVRWNERQILLKVAFPLNLHPPTATYEIPFGAIERSAKPRTPQEKAQFEVPAQQWADLSDTKFGVSLLNDSKYGYDARDGVLRLTLLRSPHYPHDTEPHKHTGERVTDQGDHEFTYALYPHPGNWKAAQTGRHARELNVPLLLREGMDAPSLPPLIGPLPPGIILDAVKKAEEGNEIIVRLHEGHGENIRMTLPVGFQLDQAFECDLLEQVTKKLKPVRARLPLRFAPYEIKTLKLKVRPKPVRS